MLITALVIAILVARELYLGMWLHKCACICSRQRGWISVEVRRRVTMEMVPSHVSAFPVPREERILVSRLFGLVLWHREQSVALPFSACEHLDHVAPQDFDRQFPAWLRVASNA